MDWLVIAGVKLLEGMFVAGALGSLLVILLTGIEDAAMLLEPEAPEEDQAEGHS